MPFYCGVQEATIPISIVSGVVFGFILMWAVFCKYNICMHHTLACLYCLKCLLIDRCEKPEDDILGECSWILHLTTLYLI